MRAWLLVVLIAGCNATVSGSAPEDPVPDAAPVAVTRADAASPDRVALDPVSPDAAAVDATATPDAARLSPDAPAPIGPPRDAGATASLAQGPLMPSGDPSNLPVLWIDAPGAIVAETKIAARLRVIDDPGNHSGLQARAASLETPIGIELRGSSSLEFPQKSFSLELRDAAGAEKDHPLTGMPSNGDWNLVACWTDKTCLRNALALSLAAELVPGRWSPRARFVEVYLNGRHNGLYLLTEAIRRGRWRVAIPEPAPTAAAGDLTGGYVFRREWHGRGMPGEPIARDWLSPQAAPDGSALVYSYHYPQPDRITLAQRAYLRDHVAAFEAAMLRSDWATAHGRWIDLESWLDFALVNEVSRNVDAYFKSVYVTKLPQAQGGLMVMTPLWDFNIAFGNADYRDGWKVDGWVWRNQGTWPTKYAAKPVPLVPFYWQRLWGDPAFAAAMRCRWKTLRQGALQTQRLEDKLGTWASALRPGAASRHFARWPELRARVWPNPCGKETPDPCGARSGPVADFYDHEVTWLRGWLRRRLTWLDANLPGSCAL